MPRNHLQPNKIPGAIVRDLLAICRALYLTRKADGAEEAELEQLTQAGKAFAQALALAHLSPDTIGGRAAWSWAERGLQLLGEVLSGGGDVSVQRLVATWEGRMVRYPWL